MGVKLERYEPNRAFKRALLTSGPVRSLVANHGEQIRSRAAGMFGATAYGVHVKTGQERVHAFVYTADRHAMASNVKHNTLLKSVGGK
jgi:hypothetical protein